MHTTEKNFDWRSRIEAVLAGQGPDIIPAAFRIDKWYNARVYHGDLPATLSGCDSLEDVYVRLGIANPARLAKVFKWQLRSPVEFKESVDGDYITRIWHTPKGDLKMVQKYTLTDKAIGLMPCTVEYPVKTFDDYPAYRMLLSHTECVPDYDGFQEYDSRIGRSGLPMVILGEIPFHSWLGHWVGYEKGYIHLFDRPDIVLEAVETANVNYRKMWQIVAESPARLVMHGVNFDTSTTPAKIYREYFLPYLGDFCKLMHSADKFVACHADGNNMSLLDLIKQTGFDVADCFACSPMVECTIEQARQAWYDAITIWGGIPSTLLEPNISNQQLQNHLDSLFSAVAPGDRFIPAIADQVMPTSTWEKLRIVLEKIKDHQSYPIRL